AARAVVVPHVHGAELRLRARAALLAHVADHAEAAASRRIAAGVRARVLRDPGAVRALPRARRPTAPVHAHAGVARRRCRIAAVVAALLDRCPHAALALDDVAVVGARLRVAGALLGLAAAGGVVTTDQTGLAHVGLPGGVTAIRLPRAAAVRLGLAHRFEVA